MSRPGDRHPGPVSSTWIIYGLGYIYFGVHGDQLSVVGKFLEVIDATEFKARGFVIGM